MFRFITRPTRWSPRRCSFPRPTLGGLIFIVATIILGAIAVQITGNVLLLIFASFVGALVVNFLAGWRALAALRISRLPPEAATAGGTSVVRYRIHNPRRFAAVYGAIIHDVAVNDATDEPSLIEAFVPVVRAGRVVTVAAPMIWPARGRYQFSRIRVSSRFPFGLMVKTLVVAAPCEFTVYPALRGLRSRPWEADLAAARATSADGQPGAKPGDEELFGLREFRQGDNPRRIHWKRSARTRRLFVREMSRPRQRQYWCVVNTRRRPGAANEQESVEDAISAAATLLCDVLERGGRIGLIANGSPAIVSPPGSGRGLRHLLLRELARRSPNLSDSLLACVARTGWVSRWRGPCLVVTPFVDDDVQEAARWLAARVGPVTLLTPGSPQFEAAFGARNPPLAWPDLAASDVDAGTAGLVEVPS